MKRIYLATEDVLSESAAEKIIYGVSQYYVVEKPFSKRGNSYLRARLKNFNEIAKRTPVFLLTDLDLKPCPVSLIREWCGALRVESNLIFRVAVREVETWLLADTAAFSEFFGISERKLSRTPEGLDDPKRVIVNLAKNSNKRDIRTRIVPDRGVRAKVGLEYNSVLKTFIDQCWDPERASCLSPSLARAMVALNRL